MSVWVGVNKVGKRWEAGFLGYLYLYGSSGVYMECLSI